MCSNEHGVWLFRSILRMCVENLKFVVLPVPEIVEGTEKNLGSPWIRPRSLFSQIFKGLLFAWTLWKHLPNLKFVALLVPEIIRGTPKLWAVSGYAHAPFSPKFFYGLLFGWTLWMSRPNLKFVALPVPEIIGGTQKIGQSLDTPTLHLLPNF